MDALLGHNVMTAAQAAAARESLASGRNPELFHALAGFVYARADAGGIYPAEFQTMFATHPVDSSSHNMRCFRVALDISASQSLSHEDLNTAPEFYRDYLASLRLIESQAQRQREVLENLGCEIVAVPSLADVPAGLNYVNGLQDKDRYFMPAQGGFYQALDDAAARAFGRALGPSVEIVPILTGECQRSHGAIHCAAAAYPELRSQRDDS
jgi:hypothetical protein